MKPRKMLPKIIPAKDINRAYRFYRDVFDFLQDGAEDARFLIVDGKPISFIQSEDILDVEILARDSKSIVEQHLKNYFIDFEIAEDKDDSNKVRFLFKDSEGNRISLQVNKKTP